MRKIFLLLIFALAFAGCKEQAPRQPDPMPTGGYTITVNAGANGTASADPAQAVPGTTVSLTATANPGYEFGMWWVTSDNASPMNARAESTKFSMPVGNVIIEAIFIEEGGELPVYKITVDSGDHGNGCADLLEALPGQTVTLNANPHPGFSFAGWTVVEGSVAFADAAAERQTFKMPAHDVAFSTAYTEIGDFDVYSVVTDSKFLAFLKGAGYDTNEDEVLTLEEAAEVFMMTVPYDSGIGSLAGIECFYNLENLNFNGNNVKTIDMTPFKNLYTLNCSTNEISEIDLSKNAKLYSLSCNDNFLTALDLSNNPGMINIYCYGNKLTELDLSAQTKLQKLDCSGNSLKNLLLPAAASFTWLQCYDNKITTLDVTGCTALTSIMCYNNPLTGLNLTKNTALTNLSANDCGLTSLDLTQNGELDQVGLGKNELSSLDLSGCPKIKMLTINDNKFTALSLSNLPALENLYASGNQLTALDVTGSSKLYQIDVKNNQIASFAATNALTWLDISGNRLTSLDLSPYDKLETVKCNNNRLTTLDASGVKVYEFDGYFMIHCGEQKTAAGADQTLTLTLAGKHLQRWNNTYLSGETAMKNLPENANVVLAQ